MTVLSFRCFRFLLVAGMALVLVVGCSGRRLDSPPPFPPAPPAGEWIYDSARLLTPSDRIEVAQVQRVSFNSLDTPIVLVTVRTLRDYGGQYSAIEGFARRWFDYWEIGKRRDDGSFINRGILLMIALDDKQACIQLGGEWGHRWDAHVKSIMETELFPHLQQQNHSLAITRTIHALGEMAKSGPLAQPPASMPASGSVPR